MQKSRRIRLFESSIEKTGRILAQKWNIKVIFKADECKTTGQVIYLPVVPNNASDELLNAMQGHLDHEAAHVIFTDFNALNLIKRREKKLFTMVNSLEDPRIEKNMTELWKGTAHNFKRKLEWALQKVVEERDMEDANGNKVKSRSWDQLSDFGKFTYAACLWAETKFDDSHWFVKDIVEPEIMKTVRECGDLIREAVDARDTQEVIDISRDIMKRLNEEDEEQDFVDPGDIGEDDIILPPQPKGADRSHMYKQPEKGKEEESEGPKVYQAEFADEDLCDACGGSGTDKDGNKCQECDGTGLSQESQEGSKAQQPVSDGNSEETGSSFRPNYQDTSNEDLDRDAELTSKENFLLEEAQSALSGEDHYLIYTTEGDVLEQIKEGDRTQYRDFMNYSNNAVSTMKRKLSRTLLSTNVSRWAGDKTRGKINPRAVFRVPLGTSKRVFRQKIEAESFNTVISIMIDHSGSMAGDKLELAAQTTIILGEVLNQLGIPFSVSGFSTRDSGEVSYGRKGSLSHKECRTYARFGDLWIGKYKDFDENWSRVAPRIIRMSENCRHNTYDGESLRWGAQGLLGRPEKRKILFWLNDGMPCPNGGDNREAHRQYAFDCAKEVESKVELMAFGIKTSAVKNYYKNYVVVNNINDLPASCLSELDALLRKTKNLKAA